MTFVSVQEWQLLSFFEVEPTFLDPNDPWEFNDAAYAIRRDDLTLTFAIAPSYRDIRIVMKRGATRLYELNAMTVDDVRYITDHWGELLEIMMSTNETLLLRVKPHIEIVHKFNGKW